jgi:hypothetical protein
LTQYTKRDIRAADMLAIILVGFGVTLLLFAVLPPFLGKGKGGVHLGLGILSGVFLMLGTVLNLKVRELIRNGGADRGEYPNVPD